MKSQKGEAQKTYESSNSLKSRTCVLEGVSFSSGVLVLNVINS